MRPDTDKGRIGSMLWSAIQRFMRVRLLLTYTRTSAVRYFLAIIDTIHLVKNNFINSYNGPYIQLKDLYIPQNLFLLLLKGFYHKFILYVKVKF